MGATEKNSCPEGTNIWVPRTQGHLNAVHAKFGGPSSALVGIYKKTDGQTNDQITLKTAMTSRTAGSNWLSTAHFTGQVDKPWFLRSQKYEEPSGDYTANCWLGYWGHDKHGRKFNDNKCNNCWRRYVCSTNQYGK